MLCGLSDCEFCKTQHSCGLAGVIGAISSQKSEARLCFKQRGLSHGRALTSHQAVSTRQVARLGAAFHIQALEQAPEVHFHGVFADVQRQGDVAVAHAFV